MSLVSALTLLFISKTLACQDVKGKCPPGCYKSSNSGKCEVCPLESYMDLNNTENSCLMCTQCGSKMQLRDCTAFADRQCVEKNTDMAPAPPSETIKVVCEPLCPNVPSQMNAAGPSTSTTTTNTTTTTTSSNGTDVNKIPHAPSLTDVTLLVSLLLFLVILIVCCVSVYKYPHLCKNSKHKQHMAVPLQADSDRCCLQSPTTLDFIILAETPMMNNMCPVTPANPAHSAPRLPNVEHSALSDQNPPETFPAIVLYTVIKEVPLRRWKELMRLLSVADRLLERVEFDVGLSSMERQYQQLRLWSQKPSAKMEDIYFALHYMDLAGCAQMISESLNQFHLTPQESVV